MRSLFTTLFGTALAVALSMPASAQQRPVVVELFTSQGCSSCPPADELLHALSERDDVIAIALHVDYWDYIGWKDEFGDPAHAERQRSYANFANRRAIYTPEILVNGQTDIVGAKPMKLSKAIAEHKEMGPEITLDIRRDGTTLDLRAEGASGPVEVHVLRILPTHTTKITRGENRGKTITYSNIAQDLRTVDQWDGTGSYTHSLTVDGDAPIVVLMQTPDGGPILAGARID
ncbi:DUF1223 domain-containing protein [Sulfitobacter albidus]|uniref:DUF1223 domain-containing protein n=1 Tax=Sulfitobacter albidus TaxID=2829501 RepID=A0A975PN21_9RHOB|nr:DUF1223 domain-containing protein [Sulfitobacter albidus]QUJ77299.1 DUF1223 domain-containing protein [Sulfitobacter albidus]